MLFPFTGELEQVEGLSQFRSESARFRPFPERDTDRHQQKSRLQQEGRLLQPEERHLNVDNSLLPRVKRHPPQKKCELHQEERHLN